MKAFNRKKLSITLALALSVGVGAAYATTTVNITGTAPKTLGGSVGADHRLYVPLQRAISIADGTAGGDIFSAAAIGNTITLTLNNGAKWTTLATSEFTATNVAFLNAATTTCSIDFTTPSTIWNTSTPETITFTVAGCSNGQPGTRLAINLSALTGTVIDISGAGTGNVTATVGGTVTDIAGDTSPVLLEVLAAPDITVSTGTASTYTAGSYYALPSITLAENAVGALGCTAGATATGAGATIAFSLPAGVQFASNVVPSIATTDPQYNVITLGVTSPSINQNYFFVPCTKRSMDSASGLANSYKPGTVTLIGTASPPSVGIPSNFTGDLKGTLIYNLSNGTQVTKEIVLATAGSGTSAAGLTGSLIDNTPTGLQTVFTGRTYGRDTAGQLRNPALADQFQVVENAIGTIPTTANGVRPKFTVTTGNAAQNVHAIVDAGAAGVYKLTETPNPLPFTVGGNASSWYVNDGDNGTSVNAAASTVIGSGHTFTFPGLTIGGTAGDVTANASVTPGTLKTTDVVIAKAINATTFSISGAQVTLNRSETATGPKLVLTENAAGALQATDGTAGTVAFDLLAPSTGQTPAGQWVVDQTTATWCGQDVPATNISMTPNVAMDDGGTRLYVKLPSISSPSPCILEVTPKLYAQNNAGAGYTITAAVFDPSDPLGVSGRTYRGTAPYASATDISTWAQPSVNTSAMRQLGTISGSSGPVSLVSATGGISNLSLTCQLEAPTSRQGRRNNIYVAVSVPNVGFFFMNGSGGWEYYSNAPGTDWAVWKNENLSEQPYIINVANGLDVSTLVGSTVYIGWGESSNEAASLGLYGECYTIR